MAVNQLPAVIALGSSVEEAAENARKMALAIYDTSRARPARSSAGIRS